MGSRSAPLVFLLLAACMTTDGADPAARAGDGAIQETDTAARRTSPASLPSIPRMRPKSFARAQRVKPADAITGGIAGGKAKPTSEETAMAVPGETGSRGGGELSPRTGDVPGVTRGPASNAELGENLPSTVPAGSFGTLPPAATADDYSPAGASTMAAVEGILPGSPVANTSLPEPSRGIDVESLFDGDVVRYCEAMWRMGEYLGAARHRGEPSKQAIAAAVRRIATERDLPLDNRLTFSGEVYGRLLYRMANSHSARTLGAYVHFACLTVRGDKKIVPADPIAERELNSGLVRCEETAVTRDDLNACIFRELTPIVDRRNG